MMNSSRFHPSNWAEVFIWQNFPAHLITDEISGTEQYWPACPLTSTHRKFYNGFSAKARSQKPGQPVQLGLCTQTRYIKLP